MPCVDMKPHRFLFVASALAGTCIGAPAFAQVGTGSLLNVNRPHTMAKLPNADGRAPPSALPGAVSRGAPAPASKPAAEMSPTDALFDAINRGDMAAARDAIGRGADLRGQDVLGMTPLELAVDLGRNDIAFLILSLRGADQTSGPPNGTQLAGPPAPPAGHPRAPARALEASVHRKGPAQAPAPMAPQTPRLFANDGGAPDPQAGFLGFNSR